VHEIMCNPVCAIIIIKWHCLSVL